VSETHLSYVAPALLALAVALVGLALSVRSRARDERGPVWRWAGAAALVGLVLWAPPVIQEATTSPGNLALLRIAATAGEPKLGIDAGGRAVAHTVGIPPWWLQGPKGPLETIADVVTRPPVLAIASTLLGLAALVALIVLGIRRGRREDVVGATLALVLCAAVAFDTASTPNDTLDTVHYTLRWATVAGMFAWLVAGWGLARLAGGLRRELPRAATVAALGAAVAVGAVVAIVASPPTEPFGPVREATERVSAELPGDGPVRIDASHRGEGLFLAIDFQTALAYSVRRDGRAVVAPTVAELLGSAYEDGEYEQVVHVAVDRPPDRSDRVIARMRVLDTFQSTAGAGHLVSVSLGPPHRQRAAR
jgi:hypothetical protein